jgi:hypothetical protein
VLDKINFCHIYKGSVAAAAVAGALGNFASTAAVDRNDTPTHIMESVPAAPVDLAAIDQGKDPEDNKT